MSRQCLQRVFDACQISSRQHPRIVGATSCGYHHCVTQLLIGRSKTFLATPLHFLPLAAQCRQPCVAQCRQPCVAQCRHHMVKAACSKSFSDLRVITRRFSNLRQFGLRLRFSFGKDGVISSVCMTCGNNIDSLYSRKYFHCSSRKHPFILSEKQSFSDTSHTLKKYSTASEQDRTSGRVRERDGTTERLSQESQPEAPLRKTETNEIHRDFAASRAEDSSAHPDRPSPEPDNSAGGEVEDFSYYEVAEDIEEYDFLPQGMAATHQVREEKVPAISLERGRDGVFDLEELLTLLDDLGAEDVVTLDIPPEARFCQHMVVASARSKRHMRAIHDEMLWLHKRKKSPHDPVLRIEGQHDNRWAAMDLGNLVLHVFLGGLREYYDLESLWTLGPDADPKCQGQGDDPYALSPEDLFWLEAGQTGKDIAREEPGQEEGRTEGPAANLSRREAEEEKLGRNSPVEEGKFQEQDAGWNEAEGATTKNSPQRRQ